MRRENKNWTTVNKKILRFGELSQFQRKSEGLDVSLTKAYLKCEECDHELVVIKHDSKHEYGWDLKNWQAVLRKSQVLKDETGYYIQSRIEFYCPCYPCPKIVGEEESN